jgi:hypothetical protein
MGRLGSFTAALLIVLSTPAAAQVKVQLHIMPPGVKLKLDSGVEVRYFTLEPYKKLLDMDKELWLARQKVESFVQVEKGLRGIIEDKDKLILSLQTSMNIMTTRSERLGEKWKTCEKGLVKARSKFSWGSFGIGLGIGSGITALTITAIVIAVKINSLK